MLQLSGPLNYFYACTYIYESRYISRDICRSVELVRQPRYPMDFLWSKSSMQAVPGILPFVCWLHFHLWSNWEMSDDTKYLERIYDRCRDKLSFLFSKPLAIMSTEQGGLGGVLRHEQRWNHAISSQTVVGISGANNYSSWNHRYRRHPQIIHADVMAWCDEIPLNFGN